jgi:hypothetical protein
MTAAGDTPATGGFLAGVKRYGPRGLIFPAVLVGVAVLFGLAQLGAAIKSATNPEPTYAASRQGTADGIKEALGGAATQDTTPATSAAPPPYDYLTCTHQGPADPRPCVPVLPWPLTLEAKELIGYENGDRRAGVLSTTNTRLLVDQIRKMPLVDACTMALGMKLDSGANRVLTIYANEQVAPEGAVKLCDCAPTANANTPATVPTVGQS